MNAVFTKEEQIEICYRTKAAQEEGYGRIFPLKPPTVRGAARLASKGKWRRRRPSHPTAPRLLVRESAEWRRHREEACLAADLEEQFALPCPPICWADDAVAVHPSSFGRWAQDCLCSEAETPPSCAAALLDAVRAELARREEELILAIIG